VDNSIVIALTKDPVFHNRSKYVNIWFHYLRDCIKTKKIKINYVKFQNQVANIFTKSLKYGVFVKIRDMLGVIKKSSLRGNVENKLYFNFSKKYKKKLVC
jgi:hypothetical protein